MSVRSSSPPPLATNVPFVEHRCDSRLRIVTCNYTWKIHDFSYYRERKTERLISSLFTAGTSNEFQWRLHLFPNGNSEKNERHHLSVYLALQSFDRPEITVTFELAIVDAKGDRTNSKKFERCTFKPATNIWGSHDFIPVAALKEASDALLADDKLTIFCSIRAFKETVHVAGQSEKDQLEMLPCSLAEDVGSLLGDRSHSDVVLVVGDEKFHAHKVILAARSRVFATMLERADRGPQQLLNIEDAKPAVIAEMLRYVYTGRAPNISELSSDLLIAAEKFGLARLKIMCEKQLRADLAVNNAADLLILADRHRAEELKVHARNFIIVHMEEVKDTPSFERMTHSHPSLLVEALSYLAMRINGNLK